ncbi:MAG: S-4TM family putative pore-forming effector [Candidatus Izemoplasma sp.]|nr:S-4TM family putative pore-forming effector [Candidatus Izemoplasma sp.]
MAKKHNIVFKRQNEKEMQSLILTQYFTYKSAKIWSGILLLVMVFIPIIINIILWINDNEMIAGYIAFASIIIIILGEILSNKVQSEKNLAAMIQQKFDLYVFNMGNISFIDENAVTIQIEKYKDKEFARKKDWYPNYEHMDSSKTVFYCQKENVDWTHNLTKRYRTFLKITIIVIMILFVTNMIANNSSFITVLSILAIALPIIAYSLSLFANMKKVDKDFDEIKRIISRVDDNLSDLSQEKLMKLTYAIQILIYRYRQKKCLIPDWFEKKNHSNLQEVENRKSGQRKRRDRENKNS